MKSVERLELFNSLWAKVKSFRSVSSLVENLKANHDYGDLYIDADKVVNVSLIQTYHPVICG